MERIGEVTAVRGEWLEITFCRPADCEKCQACHGGQKQTTLMVRGSANVGDSAVVDMPADMVMKASATAYLIPLAGLLIGLFTGAALFPAAKDVAALIGALVGLGAAAAIVKGTEKFRRGKAEWAPQLKEIIAAKQNKE